MSAVPSPQQFFLDTPPYHWFVVGSDGYIGVLRIQFYLGTLDTYCPECSRDSVFRSLAPPLRAATYQGTGPARVITVDELLDGKLLATWPYQANLPSMELKPRSLAEMEPLARANRVFQVEFACTRDDTHSLFFFFRVQNDQITKVGQSPSLA